MNIGQYQGKNVKINHLLLRINHPSSHIANNFETRLKLCSVLRFELQLKRQLNLNYKPWANEVEDKVKL